MDAEASRLGELRAAIRAACRRPEAECLPPLLDAAAPSPSEAAAAARLAADLVARLRARPRAIGVEALVHEYALSSPEGVALMCLAEALLRIPDDATRDALIRDWIALSMPSASVFACARLAVFKGAKKVRLSSDSTSANSMPSAENTPAFMGTMTLGIDSSRASSTLCKGPPPP